MEEDTTIGAIRVTRMIWTATLLSLGAIYYCVSLFVNIVGKLS
jgi:hypothetical protein